MKLASLRADAPDGALVVVSRDMKRAVNATGIAATLRAALANWSMASPKLQLLAAQLEEGDVDGIFDFDPALALAPLPKPAQWLDGSAFRNHGMLMARAFGMDDIAPSEWPLMYQGLADYTYAAQETVHLPSEADGIDFEGEFAIVVDDVPMGVTPEQAIDHVKLILLANDWSLRAFGPREMKAGFGFILAKPATAFAPLAVTPDEIGDRWNAGRVALDLHVWRGETLFGRPNGQEMSFDFGRLIAHAAYNRRLSAGTVIGSGTVSNADFDTVGSTCIAERRSIEVIQNGTATTSFLTFGETVRMEAFDQGGQSVFGRIDQRVQAAGSLS